MAYNKSKYVEAAQKLLNQGKVPQAINEYQHILKYEPKDQVTLMTIGELYIRQGETFQAIEYFERLAQIFVGDGFLTKAIAVYKRIAKLAPEEFKPLERLADLYVQQGVMSEARPLFLQLAEIHLKHNRQAEAVALLKKLLQAEPDNLRIQIRLADLYQAMGQKGEAVDTYVSAAQRALARGDHAESEKQADKALKIDSANPAALTVKARSASSQGKFAEAAQFLKGLPGLDKGGEQSEFLLDLYLKSSSWDDASALALQVFEGDEKNFGLAQKVAEGMLESGQAEPAMALVSRLRIPMLDAGEHDAITRMLNELASRTPGRLDPLEWLVDSYARTSDSFRLPDALAHLGDALAEANQLHRAKEIFEQLVDRQPESDFAKRKLNAVLRRMGVSTPDEGPEPITETLQAELQQPEAPKLRPDLNIPEEEKVSSAAALEEGPDEGTQKFISQSLTDVDLFASYGLTQKAIGLLEAILRRAPNHTPTLEKLLDFVLGAGDDRRTAELAAKLEKIHKDRGDGIGAERFGELRRRFQRAAGLTDEEIAAAAAPAPAPQAAVEQAAVLDSAALDELPLAPAEAKPAAPAPEVQEVDLSDEWASLLANDLAAADTTAVPPPPPPAAPQEKAPPPVAAGPPPISEFEIPFEERSEPAIELIEPTPETPRKVAPPPPPPPPPPPVEKAAPPEAAKEIDLAEEYELVLSPEPDAEPSLPAPVPASGDTLASDQFLSDLADEIDKLGIGELT